MADLDFHKLFDLKGRVAVITGGAGDIGKTIAAGLASAGANVFLMDSKPRSFLEEIAQSLQNNYGIKARAHRVDVGESSSVEEGFIRLIEEMSTVDILINCAGIIRRGAIIDTTEKDLADTIQVNLQGTYRCTKAAGPHLIEKRCGKVINFASTNADAGIKNHAAYCASKGGVISFTKAMAIEWAEYGINVNAISPNVVRTSMTENRLSKPGEAEKSISRIPWGRLLVPEDLVGPVLFLASSASDLVTGHVLNVDGGYVAQ